MDFDRDFLKSAFSRLASSDFSQMEFAILYYFFSQENSCFDPFLVKPSHLAQLLQTKEKNLLEALYFLEKRKVIVIKESKQALKLSQKNPMAVSVNRDYKQWLLPKSALEKKDVSVSIPKPIKISSSLNLIRRQEHQEKDLESQVKLIVDFFQSLKGDSSKNFGSEVLEEAEKLIKKYSFDAVLFVLKHLYQSIESLKDLAVQWDFYQDQLQKLLRKIDFIEAKKQHDKDDNTLREEAKKWLFQSSDKNLNSEETRVLEILVENPHPRRQLFWAYRFRENYPGLDNFFQENFKLMLPVTTKGKVVNKSDG